MGMNVIISVLNLFNQTVVFFKLHKTLASCISFSWKSSSQFLVMENRFVWLSYSENFNNLPICIPITEFWSVECTNATILCYWEVILNWAPRKPETANRRIDLATKFGTRLDCIAVHFSYKTKYLRSLGKDRESYAVFASVIAKRC